MTVLSELCKRTFLGDNVTSAFPTGFRFLANAHLLVLLNGATLTEIQDYTVTGAGDQAGGTVTLVAGPLANGSTLTVTRTTPGTQEVDLVPNGPYLPDDIEAMHDKPMLCIDELKVRVAALEALASGLIGALGTLAGAKVQVDFTTNAASVEATFPFNVAVANGSTAQYVLIAYLQNRDNTAEVFDEPPSIQWDTGLGNAIVVKRVSGLKPATNYRMRLLVIQP